MFKTIDDIMYITDGNNPWGYGLGFKPTHYNIKGSGFLEDIDKKIKQLEPFVKSTGKGKKMLSELFRIKYGNIKQMKGGTLTDDLNIIGLDISELEKMNEEDLRNQYDENLILLKEMEDKKLTEEGEYEKKVLENETEHIWKILDNIEKEETNIENNEDSFFESDEFKEQMKWYEENYDKLDEEEMFNYMESLAKLKEIENKNKGISKEFTELDKKLYKVAKDFKDLYGDIGYNYEDEEEFEKEIDKWYIPKIEPEKYINKLIYNLRNIYNGMPNKLEIIGEKCEEFYTDKKLLFTTLNNNKDFSNIYNSSNTINNLYYTSKMKIIGERKVYLKGFEKKKADFYLVDFMSEKYLYEMKALEKSFDDFYKKGSIHLVGTKVFENDNYKAKFIYDDKNNKIIVENIGYRNHSNEPISFKTLSNNNYEYISIFVLSDGIYSCNLSNPKLWNIDKDGKPYFKYPKDKYGNVHIPINFIERIDKKIIDEINK